MSVHWRPTLEGTHVGPRPWHGRCNAWIPGNFEMMGVGLAQGAPWLHTARVAMKVLGFSMRALKQGRWSIKDDAGCSTWNQPPVLACAVAKRTVISASVFAMLTRACAVAARPGKPAGNRALRTLSDGESVKGH